MSDIRKVVDARDLACPQPVILTRKALAEGGFDLLELIVDNAAARENVVRYAGYARCAVESVKDEGRATHILIRPTAGAEIPEPRTEDSCTDEEAEADRARQAGGATVLISADRIGRGDDDLGVLLMRGFLYTLTEAEAMPKRIILMNSGVRLAVHGSESLVNLNRLDELGVEILACGTCLEFYKLKDELAAGRVSNMYEIAGFLLEGRTLSL